MTCNDYEQIISLYKKYKCLILTKEENERFYYGLNYYPDGPKCAKEIVEKIENILKNKDKDIIKFCGFIKDSKETYLKTIEHYDSANSNFKGVVYYTFEELKELLCAN